MGEQPANLTLYLDTEQPIELSDFLGAFTSVGNQLERYARSTYDGAKVETTTYVKEVRHGSVEADLTTTIIVAYGVAVTSLDQALILEDFVRRWGYRITSLVKGDKAGQPDTKRDLADFANALETIATDPVASHRLEAATFEDGERKVRASFRFTNADAQSGLLAIEDRRRELNMTEGAEHRRVLMMFTRSDVRDATVGKRSDDRVVIPELSNRRLAVIYASELAEERIRYEVRDADDNLYKKGFIVDVNVRTNASDKPVVYAVTALHSVVDLPDDD